MMNLRSTGWFLLAIFLMLPVQAMGQAESESPGDPDKKSPDSFSCTQILGFSQSLEWYGGLSLADYTAGEGPPEPPSLEVGAFLPTWQGRFYLGAAVERWTDPEFSGWSGTHPAAYETAAHCAREEVDRVVFNVSGAARSPDEWASAIASVAELIREKFPAARQIVMQPVVGAPEGKCRQVRAARNHPDIVEGIRRSAERGEIIAGPSPEVASCAQFRDALGHLTEDGARHVRQALKAHYRDTTVLPEDETGSVGGSSPELLRRSYTSSETERKRVYFVYLPRGYHDEPRKDWPVIFYLHGGGERGDGREDLVWVLGYGPVYEAWIQKRDLPFIMVSPQLPVFGMTEQVDEGRSVQGWQPPRRLDDRTPPRYEICSLEGDGDCLIAPHRRAYNRARGEAQSIARTGAGEFERIRPFDMDFDYPPEEWPPDGWFRVEEDLVTILDDVLEAFRADPDRVYLTGVSYGGFGAFDLAASHPGRWAALAPVVGTGDLDDAPVLAEAGIPIWMFAGGTDPLVKPHWLYEMARALEEAGHPNVRFTVHEDMTHDAWLRVYEGRDLYDWFLSKSRAQRAGGTSASIQDPLLVVENARVIVGDGTVLERGSVVVAGGQIASVTDQPVDAPEARRVDASGKTVLPGLIDAHVHLLLENDEPPVADSDRAVGRFIEHRLPARLEAYLQAGFTSIMSMGDFWPHVRDVRERLASRELRGPRLSIVGPLFTAPGTHPAYTVCEDEEHRNPWCRKHLVREVDKAKEARTAVRRLASGGTDAIKVVYSGRSPIRPPVTRAITEEAHRHGLTVYMHPGDDEKAIRALDEWGADRFAHVPETGSSEMAEKVTAAMTRHGATAATTLSVFVVGAVQAAEREGQCDERLADSQDRKLAALDELRQTLRALRGADALAFGTDVPMLSPSDAVACELRLLADAGLDEDEILRALTVGAAAHIGRSDELGTLKPGKLADLIVVDGNPLEDISALRNVELVVKGGEILVKANNEH